MYEERGLGSGLRVQSTQIWFYFIIVAMWVIIIPMPSYSTALHFQNSLKIFSSF